MKNPVQNLFASTGREPWTGQERRCEPREDADCPAQMKVLDPRLSGAPFIDSHLVSVSAKGLQLRAGFIVPNQPVQIQLPGRTLAGRVRYCISAGDGFHIGIRINEC